MAELWETYWRKLPRGTKGDTGSDGTAADHGPWALSHSYLTGDRCTHARSGHGNSVYRCILGHTSSATDEPEVGVNRDTYWILFAEGGADGAGSGDFVGVATSVTDNLVAFADTGGKAAKDSGVGIDDVNFYNLVENTQAIDPDGDFLKVWKAIDSSYHRVAAFRLGRKTESIILTAQGIWKRYTNGCNVSDNVETTSVKRYISRIGFSEVAKAYAECEFILPWYYDGGTVTVRFHWFVTSAAAGTVLWGIQGLVCGDGDSLDAADGTAQEISDATQLTAYDLLISEPTPALTLAGTPAGGKSCLLTIYRDPLDSLDTFASTAYLKGIEIRYGCTE